MRNGGAWTEARFRSFIRGGLRSISMRWPPKNKVKQNARVQRGVYLCAGYKTKAHEVAASLPPLPGNKRRINNSVVDHINPVVNPTFGFVSWDELIKRLFCETEGFQLLCHDCHKNKTADERKER
ncbi:MAG: HNH endonuclease [Thaumarchaeota archaeon]|nr:HNH endonuclease [Nitrososphaerota archaeon]